VKKSLVLAFLFIFFFGCNNYQQIRRDTERADRVLTGTERQIRDTILDSICMCGDRNSSDDMNCACMRYRTITAASDFVHGVSVFITQEDNMVIYSAEIFTRIVFESCTEDESVERQHLLNHQRMTLDAGDRNCETFYLFTNDGRRSRNFSMDFAEPPDPPPDPETSPARIFHQGPA
jgi:hypothetical protein